MEKTEIRRATTLGGAVAELRDAFQAAGLPSPGLDARVLVAEAAGVPSVHLLAHSDAELTAAQGKEVAAMARRRLSREPVARIVGQAEFWGLPFRLSPETLVPRPDTETVVEAVLARIADRTRPVRLLDLGTGSGCLLVALLSELPVATGLGIDRSPGALATARENARRNGVGGRTAFVAADWAAPVVGRFDVIVSNPPYVTSDDVPRLDPEVAIFDPRPALDGGPDGLAAYRRVFAESGPLLEPGGFVAVELGHDQRTSVSVLARSAGLDILAARADLGGHDRVLVFGAS